MAPIRRKRKVVFASLEWYQRLTSGVTSMGGQSCTYWHLNKLVFDLTPPVGHITRAKLINWINVGIATTENYKLARVALAINICRNTIGLTSADVSYFVRWVKRIIPPEYR